MVDIFAMRLETNNCLLHLSLDNLLHTVWIMLNTTTRWLDKCDKELLIFGFVTNMSIVLSMYSIQLCGLA